MLVILQHRHDPNNPNNDRNNGNIDLAWFSQGRPELANVTATRSELEGYGYGNMNGSAMALDARREHDTSVAFSRLVCYDNHRNREKSEDGNPRTSVTAGADEGIELRLPMGQGGTGRSNPRLS
jgi:hypothetical protein